VHGENIVGLPHRLHLSAPWAVGKRVGLARPALVLSFAPHGLRMCTANKPIPHGRMAACAPRACSKGCGLFSVSDHTSTVRFYLTTFHGSRTNVMEVVVNLLSQALHVQSEPSHCVACHPNIQLPFVATWSVTAITPIHRTCHPRVPSWTTALIV